MDHLKKRTIFVIRNRKSESKMAQRKIIQRCLITCICECQHFGISTTRPRDTHDNTTVLNICVNLRSTCLTRRLSAVSTDDPLPAKIKLISGCRDASESIRQHPVCTTATCLALWCLQLLVSRSGNDLLEYSPYEPVNSRLSDIFRLAPIIAGKTLLFSLLTLPRVQVWAE